MEDMIEEINDTSIKPPRSGGEFNLADNDFEIRPGSPVKSDLRTLPRHVNSVSYITYGYRGSPLDLVFC
ncbi:hypothetical protein J6590_006667 [Homalodisca vitripennis]|nr:hypothetical protein J6590_006667 [Homalodisca vitripennis]